MLFKRAILVLLAVLMVACVPKNPDVIELPLDFVRLEVENYHWGPVVVYISDGGRFTRVGSVESLGKHVLRIPRSYMNRTIQLQVRPLGEMNGWISPQVNLTEPKLQLWIQNSLSLSAVLE